MTIPQNPRIGQLYYDYPTATMRRWDGKKWAEMPNKKAVKEFEKIADQLFRGTKK